MVVRRLCGQEPSVRVPPENLIVAFALGWVACAVFMFVLLVTGNA